MRTTIDLPDDLLRRAKSTAALRGIKLNELLQGFVERGLSEGAGPERYGHREPIPVSIPPAGRTIPSMTNAELYEMFDREDLERNAGSA